MSRKLYELLRPLFFRLDPETAHHFAMFWLEHLPSFLLELFAAGADKRLEREVFGLKFPNPVGLAAGFDKNAEALRAWQALGFGFVEAGTITARAQPGNPKPRVFRIPEHEALINRMGFNNDGSEVIARRLGMLKASGRWPSIPIGINIGKSRVTPLEEATADYLFSFEKLFAAGDYFVLNVSSPNTPGLRTLQNRGALEELFKAVQEKNFAKLAPKPLLVKIAPDLEFAQIEEILGIVEAHKLAGIVATNTTLDHSGVPESERREGGLSGKPLRQRATEIVRFIASKSRVPIVAAGGIFDADSALEKLDAGASLIQIYTGFIYRGPALVKEICVALSGRARNI
jgi:dihydroorotate dehydrogenase